MLLHFPNFFQNSFMSEKTNNAFFECYRMGPVIQLKNAVIGKGAMWERVQRVMACVAHVCKMHFRKL